MNHVLKSYCILIAILLQIPSYPQGTWEKINVPTGQFLRSISFTDSLYGWVAGDSGTIIHTTDGGKSWTVQGSKSADDIASVFFIDRNLGWASAQNYLTPPFGTHLLKTTNEGTNWDTVPFPYPDVFINCIWFRDPMNGWMAGSPNAILKTTDGGSTWTRAAIDTSTLAFMPVMRIKFYDEKWGYACGGIHDVAGVIWRTNNGGDLWYAIDPSDAPADEIYELHLFDSLKVLGAGGDPDFSGGVAMISTKDGGLNWDYKETGFQGNAFDIDFRNDKEAWAPLGPQRQFIFSKDSGITWKLIPTPDSTWIYTMAFTDSLHGFAAGRYGAMLKFKPEITGSVEPGTELNKNGITLYQNYPNPANSSTTIKFKVPSTGKFQNTVIQIKLFDVFGKENATLVNKTFSSGEYNVVFDVSGLTGGVYFYQMVAGTFSISKRMILIK